MRKRLSILENNRCVSQYRDSFIWLWLVDWFIVTQKFNILQYLGYHTGAWGGETEKYADCRL